MSEPSTEKAHAVYKPVTDTPDCYLRQGEDEQTPLDYPPYKSSRLRHPKQPLVFMPQTITEITGPQLGRERVLGELDNDLTRQHAGEPIGQRITLSGRVLDTEGKPLRGTLVEIWQANAAGRYRHRWDRWPAPLDPNFTGAGRAHHRRRRPLQLHDDQAGTRTRGATTTTPGALRTSTSRCSVARSCSGS